MTSTRILVSSYSRDDLIELTEASGSFIVSYAELKEQKVSLGARSGLHELNQPSGLRQLARSGQGIRSGLIGMINVTSARCTTPRQHPGGAIARSSFRPSEMVLSGRGH